MEATEAIVKWYARIAEIGNWKPKTRDGNLSPAAYSGNHLFLHGARDLTSATGPYPFRISCAVCAQLPDI